MGDNACGVRKNPVITPEINEVIEQSPFVPVVTASGDGQPHLIVVGKVKEVLEDTVVLGIYRMKKTRENLSRNSFMQVAVVSGKKGYRLSGKARVDGEEVLLAVEYVDSLL